MIDPSLIFIGGVLLLAGFAKGVIGLGLPTIAMGLLALALTPVEAAAILILPSLVTNLWQMLVGPGLGRIVRRLWPMMLAVCLGTWAGLGLMTGSTARFGSALRWHSMRRAHSRYGGCRHRQAPNGWPRRWWARSPA